MFEPVFFIFKASSYKPEVIKPTITLWINLKSFVNSINRHYHHLWKSKAKYNRIKLELILTNFTITCSGIKLLTPHLHKTTLLGSKLRYGRKPKFSLFKLQNVPKLYMIQSHLFEWKRQNVMYAKISYEVFRILI